ncbi:MAG TPA: DUF4340 domain-containing protein [Chloroflexota bacterium]|nr:DUF4340 domain-containing protein [Chloroflexota bacterium]
MNFRLTAALLGILVLLGGVVYYVSNQASPSAATASAKTPQIVTFASAEVSKLIVSSGKTTMEVDKSGANWQLVQPTKGPADPNRVQGWLDQLSALTADRVITDTTDLGQYGLTSPTFTTEVTLTAGKKVTISFGNKTPDGGDYYARVAGSNPVYLVSATLGDDLKSAMTQPPVPVPTQTIAPTLPANALPPTPVVVPTPTA